jgi:SAM-dependent methyltransferase
MYRLAREKLDALVDAHGEDLPFRSDVFDITTVRQGIQFMDAAKAVREMARVTRPGGRLCLVQLCAYGSEDREEYFEILRLRNPARRNFFLRTDLQSLLLEAGCSSVVVHDYISTEDVEAWADHGAIEEERREAIRQRYRDASHTFKALHGIEVSAGRVLDRMLFGIAVGVKDE